MSVLETLKERGFVDNTTHEGELAEYLGTPGQACYVGFDPTGDSLHVGHLVTIMSLAHMQRAGHRPFALVGGGTGMIGDPSGKTEMRKLLTPEIIDANKEALKTQLGRFLDFSSGNAMLVDNADWLIGLGYIPFLREIGRNFSVNRMIKVDSYRTRIESDEGLSFIEFNYMLLQAYDFHVLAENHDCLLQMGGSDQWGNIVAGVELIRRMQQKTAFGITFPLIMTASGIKMGKTHSGAVWLDPAKTSPYDYYQFWVNTDDRDVERFLALFTFLPMEEIRSVATLEGAEINMAKAVLAFEATKLAHGQDDAVAAQAAAASMFGGKAIAGHILPYSDIPRAGAVKEKAAVPQVSISSEELEVGIPAAELFFKAGLAQSKGAARRLIDQGGAYIGDERASSFDQNVTLTDAGPDGILLRAGKKRYCLVIPVG